MYSPVIPDYARSHNPPPPLLSHPIPEHIHFADALFLTIVEGLGVADWGLAGFSEL